MFTFVFKAKLFIAQRRSCRTSIIAEVTPNLTLGANADLDKIVELDLDKVKENHRTK